MIYTKATRPVAARVGAYMALLALLAMLFLGGQGTAGASPSRSLDQYRQWIAQAKAMYPYPQSADKMYRTMLCESSGNASVVGGTRNGYYGLFQYAPSTWHGGWNPYRNSSLFDAKAQIFATAKAWSIGMQGQWSCYSITPGR
ncbi:MAG: transglycosylase family protein [Chloroflexota bacterium]|nr:transglycosylase family protein [Chloroflexota bacterium]